VFVHELVAGFVALAEAHYGAFWRPDAAGRLVPQQELMPRVSNSAARAWAPVLEELAAGVLQQNIIRYHRVPEPADQLLTGETYMALGFPVAGQALVAGCVTVVVKGDSAVLTGAGVALLRLMSEFGTIYSSADSAAHYKNFYGSLSSAWDVVGEALAFTKPTEIAQVLADKSRAALGAQRVSVGLVKRGKIHVTSISGEDVVDKRSNIVRLIQAAQTEVMISARQAATTAPPRTPSAPSSSAAAPSTNGSPAWATATSPTACPSARARTWWPSGPSSSPARRSAKRRGR